MTGLDYINTHELWQHEKVGILHFLPEL